MSYETDPWPFVPARDFTKVTAKRAVRVIVIHTMEAPEGDQTAENVARYFQKPDYKSSAHVCIDDNSVIQCVYDNNVAYAAPGCNNDGIQLELAGVAGQSVKQWRDPYSIAVVAIAADVAGQYCLKYGLPALHLSNEMLRLGGRGIIGHAQASAVYKKSDHTDPGPNYPWDRFMAAVKASMAERSK